MRVSTRIHGLTLVETLAALALLSILVAATSALTSHIAGVSAARQSEARGHFAVTAASELIAFDLDDWSAACDKGEPTVPAHELITISPTEIELRYPKQNQQPNRTIRYRLDEVSGVLTRSDSENSTSTERIVIGELTRFNVAAAADQIIGSDNRSSITIQLTGSTGVHQVIVVRLPAAEPADG